MRMTASDFFEMEQTRRGDSEAKTARLLGMTQASYNEGRKKKSIVRCDKLIRYAQNTGYEVVIVPKEYVGLLSESIVVLENSPDNK